MNVTQPDAFLGHEMSCDNPCLSQLIFSSKVEKWACISVTDERNPFRRSFLTCYAAKSIAVSKLIDPTRVLKPDTGAYGVRNRRVSKLIDPMRVLKRQVDASRSAKRQSFQAHCPGESTETSPSVESGVTHLAESRLLSNDFYIP